MQLPDNFSFNQNNLQDYVDCEYRFLLKHIRRLEWPAVESEPQIQQEQKMEMGFQFHRLIQQYFSGIDAEILSASIENPELQSWWSNFLLLQLMNLPGDKYAEKLISTAFHGYRLVAKFDFLIVNKDSLHIYDWKTTVFQPKRQYQLDRIQAKVYPLLLMLQNTQSAVFPVNDPASIEMTFWYPSFPDTPISFCFSQEQFDEDLIFVENLVEQIKDKPEESFTKTSQKRKCKFCRYRSLCERGITAGTASEEDESEFDEDPFSFDFNAL